MASSNAKTASTPEYEIKHRLAGAVVLVLIAVVVIPLLLSEPALEANNNSASATAGGKDFESRIVPLNINNATGASNASALVGIGSEQLAAGSPDATIVDDSRPALLDLTGSAAETPNDGAVVMTRNAPASTGSESTGSNGTGSGNNEKTQQKAVIAADESTRKTAEPVVPEATEKETKQAESDSKEPAEPVQLASTQQTMSVQSGDAGWVVRVGTFSKSANVESVSSLLTNSGFKPKTTSVSTSLGNSTRVWLGPYAKRETADKISDRLKTLTGEKGYVTRTSS